MHALDVLFDEPRQHPAEGRGGRRSAAGAGSRWSASNTARRGTDGLHDSPLEGSGFELLVPRHESPRFPKQNERPKRVLLGKLRGLRRR
jgi:hypothetical protein